MESFSKGEKFYGKCIISIIVVFQATRLLQKAVICNERRLSRWRKWYNVGKHPHLGQSMERKEIHPEGGTLLPTKAYDKL